MDSGKVREEAGRAVSEIVQLSIAAVLKKEGPEGAPDAAYVGCNAALCALVPTSALLVKKPRLTKEQLEQDGAKIFAKLISFEAILFTALATARMHQGLQVEGSRVVVENGTGFEIVGQVNFGPDVLFEALEDWKKLTGKNPDDYFDPKLLAAIREINGGALIPLNDFLEKRKNSSPTSNTLQ
jgi:hypothetical protein